MADDPFARVLAVAFDVDSTVVTHEYPDMGEDLGAIPWIKKILALDPERVKIMLCTMRSDNPLAVATEVVTWGLQGLTRGGIAGRRTTPTRPVVSARSSRSLCPRAWVVPRSRST